MRYAILAAFVALAGGCVPVTEPLSDVEKAAPDKALVGEWVKDADATTADLTIDVPNVKGNPKGLMRAVETDPKNAIWFFTTKIGKYTYTNLILVENGSGFVQFAEEGAFAKWQKDGAKRYFLIAYAFDGDKVLFDGGSVSAVTKLMEAEKVARSKGNDFFYETPAGLLAKYLDKNDPAAIFDGTNTGKYSKLKKK